LNPAIAYGLTMLLAIVAGAVLLHFTQQKLPLRWWEKFGLGIGAFCGGMIGSKLPFVLADLEGLQSGVAWFDNGKTIMCGLVGAYLGVEIAKWTLDIRVRTGDSFAVPAAVAIGIGRIACFVGGCCYGTPTALPWGVRFAGESDPRHPTQLYETAFHFTMALVLWQLQKRGMFRGQLFKLYLICYLAYRFASEFLRPEARLWLDLTGYQWAALLLMPLFAWLWWRDERRYANADGGGLSAIETMP
jgi:phosphatidylglycerol:prolipoprotein diacylglycerol transferase